MRKWFMLVLLGAFLAAAMSGCGKKAEEETTEETKPAEEKK